MTTVTVQLPDDVYALLEEQARAEGTSVASLVERGARQVSDASRQARTAALRHLERYPRLFERLAE